jgi:hypothetical protein
MICNIDSDCDSNDIRKRIDVLKSAIPEEWTKTIQAEIHNRLECVDEILQVVHKK